MLSVGSSSCVAPAVVLAVVLALVLAACDVSGAATGPHAARAHAAAAHAAGAHAAASTAGRGSGTGTGRPPESGGSAGSGITLAFAGDVHFTGRTARLLQHPATAFRPTTSLLPSA